VGARAVTENPLVANALFHIGPVPITGAVVTSWLLMAVLTGLALLVRARLRVDRPGALQAAAELVVTTIETQIREVTGGEPGPYLPLVGTLFLYLAAANSLAVVPGLEPPTARLETDAALALVVFVAVHVYGVRSRGLLAYLAGFAKPAWVMLPLNLVSELTRAFSLMVRLFGNMMSGVFVIGIALSLAGLFVPIPLMALHLLTGLIQAYIFTMLALVFVAAAGSTEKG
jgi:F-type H+-transporting ATPase subunit a